MIKLELGITDFKEVLAFAKGFVGYQADSEFVPIKSKVEQKEAAKNKHDSKSDYAQDLVQKSQPLTGTAGEQYIHNRGLFNIGHSDVRYSPAFMQQRILETKLKPQLLLPIHAMSRARLIMPR